MNLTKPKITSRRKRARRPGRQFWWLTHEKGFIHRVKLNLREKQSLYHELQQFLVSGIPLPQAVEALMPETGGDVRRVLSRLLKLFLSGESVPAAFASLSPTVGSLEISLIEASSSTGRLEQAFIYLANYFGALETVRAKIVGGLIWPAVQLHIGVLVSNLIPLFLGGMDWNAYYAAVRHDAGRVLLVAAVIWFAGLTLANMGRTDATIDWLLGRLPLAGKLRRNLSLSRFCATYEMQLQAGINIPDSLTAAADASQSARIKAFIARVLPRVRGGESFGSALSGKSVLPAALQRAVRLGEETGDLDENLRRWADYYQKAAINALDAAGRWVPRVFYFFIAGYLIYCILGAELGELKFMNQMMDSN